MDAIDQKQQEQLDKNDTRDSYQWAALIGLAVAVIYLTFVWGSIQNGAASTRAKRVILEIVPADLKEACAFAR